MDARVVVLANLKEVLTNGGRASFAAELCRAVAPPDRLFGFSIRDHVLVTVVEEDFAPFWRLSKNKLLLAELFAADDISGKNFFCEGDKRMLLEF